MKKILFYLFLICVPITNGDVISELPSSYNFVNKITFKHQTIVSGIDFNIIPSEQYRKYYIVGEYDDINLYGELNKHGDVIFDPTISTKELTFTLLGLKKNGETKAIHVRNYSYNIESIPEPKTLMLISIIFISSMSVRRIFSL